MRARGWGRVINISSMNALRGQVGQPNYSAAKAGIIGLTKSMARELSPRGVRVNAVAPGPVLPDDFPNMDAYKQAMRSNRVGKGDDIAAMVAMLMSGDGEWINGQILSVDGGMSMRP